MLRRGCGAVHCRHSESGAAVDERPIGEPIERLTQLTGALMISVLRVTIAEDRPQGKLDVMLLASINFALSTTYYGLDNMKT